MEMSGWRQVGCRGLGRNHFGAYLATHFVEGGEWRSGLRL